MHGQASIKAVTVCKHGRTVAVMGEKIRLNAFFTATLDWVYVASFVLRRF